MKHEKDAHQIKAELDDLVHRMSQQAVQQFDELVETQRELGQFMQVVAGEVAAISDRVAALEANPAERSS